MPQTGPNAGLYQYRDAEFWTCGFFPGSLYCLLERSVKYPQAFLSGPSSLDDTEAQWRQNIRGSLSDLCKGWSEPLHDMAHRKDTHDIGFIVEPALRRDFELTGNRRSYDSIQTAAQSLASRYNKTTQAIRSWDTFVNIGHSFDSKDECFLVIIDSMCSKYQRYMSQPPFSLIFKDLDILYYAGHHSGTQRLIDIATTHAHTVRKTHLRREALGNQCKYPEYSTCHVANVCAKSGQVLQRLSAQGYSDTSTWARGQAWAILGYAQTYSWTKDYIFLETACGIAEHFIARMEAAPSCVEVNVESGGKAGRYVPLWDFDAPIDSSDPLRDSSAGMIAANGLLIIANSLVSIGEHSDARRYMQYAMIIVTDTIALCYAQDTRDFCVENDCFAVRNTSEPGVVAFDAILQRSTANFNDNWTDKYYNHGLVYADYYFLEFGNRLLQMGYF